MTLTKEQAALLCDIHEIASLLADEEEVEILASANPQLLEAYRALAAIAADGKEEG